ncbi:MAG TPA: hypothetical protein VGG01_18805 [Xanthobacteraceae bacterium]|jgi:hypothetical protein
MACKKCGAQMRFWLERASFRTFECPSCEFVAIEAREDEQAQAAQVNDQQPVATPGRTQG